MLLTYDSILRKKKTVFTREVWQDHRFSENLKIPLFYNWMWQMQKNNREIIHTPLGLIIIHQDAFKCTKQEI